MEIKKEVLKYGVNEYIKSSFKLGDVPENVKFIGCKRSDEVFSDGDDTVISFLGNPKFITDVIDPEKIYYKDIKVAYDIGYMFFKGETPLFIVGIYEPGAVKVSDRGIITITGHEEVINIWIEDGYSERFYTR